MHMTKIELKRLAKRLKYCINQCLSSCTRRNVIICVFYFTTFVPTAEFMQFQLVGYHYVRVSHVVGFDSLYDYYLLSLETRHYSFKTPLTTRWHVLVLDYPVVHRYVPCQYLFSPKENRLVRTRETTARDHSGDFETVTLSTRPFFPQILMERFSLSIHTIESHRVDGAHRAGVCVCHRELC